MFELHDKIYTDINEYLEIVSHETFSRCYQWRKQGGYHVINTPCAFDIETSSFYEGEMKRATMYVWQFAINGYVFIGRTWGEFQKFLHSLEYKLNIDDSNRLYVYVHNLSYEFQFMRKWFQWENVFAVDSRTPIKALTIDGVEFRDSYILSGYKLEKVGEQLQKYKIKKLVGDLDYNVMRTSDTKLSEDELHYCVNDVLVVSAYIQEQIETYGGITKVPLTNTGRVREYCRNCCFYGADSVSKKKSKVTQQYQMLMKSLTLEPDEYMLCKRAFMGGFTHASALHVKKTVRNVSSYDFTSSYPAVMLLNEFPMGKGFKVTISSWDEYKKYSEQYCLIFDMKLEGLRPKIFSENPLSYSKCWKHCSDSNIIVNNGRIVEADWVMTSGTNIDLDIYMKFYSIEHLYITNCYAYVKHYLPRNFLLSILKLYKDKTELKNVEGKEVEYLHSKGMLNSCYGMMVTDIVKDEQIYDKEWQVEKADLNESIDKYNKNKNRFLFFPQGIFVTAYARRNLFSAIANIKSDYVYADTDSVKIINRNEHLQYFKDYNSMILLEIKKCCALNNLDESMFMPKTKEGKTKVIGIWDYEGDYEYFKTLGAKRYIYVQNNKLHVTIAGVGKKSTQDYFMEVYKTWDKIFKAFDNNLSIPENFTGKLTHTYIDDEFESDVLDYQGHLTHVHELSYIHLEKTGFQLSMLDSFIKYVMGVQIKYEL